MLPWNEIREYMTSLRAQNERSIVLRRGGGTLAAQSVRIERKGNQSQTAQSTGTRRALTAITINGDIDLDIAVGDRFTLDGIVYEVEFVHPTRLACTLADATATE